MMREFMPRAALGLAIIVAGLVAAAPASADQHRLRNAYIGNGSFYLGVAGGPINNSYVTEGTAIIVWQHGQNDQIWNVPDADGYGQFSDYYPDSANNSVCIGVAGGSGAPNGARMIVQQCNEYMHPEQVWQIIPSSKLGNNYGNCFVIWNGTTGKALGVQGGDSQVKNGSYVIQWTYDGTANQFWCEEAP